MKPLLTKGSQELNVLAETEKVLTLEKWKELMSKEFQFEEEKPKSVSKLYEMYGDDLDEG